MTAIYAIIGGALLLSALSFGLVYGALRVFIDDTSPDWPAE